MSMISLIFENFLFQSTSQGCTSFFIIVGFVEEKISMHGSHPAKTSHMQHVHAAQQNLNDEWEVKNEIRPVSKNHPK